MSTQILEKEELTLLREQMLSSEELFLLQFLKGYNRKKSQRLADYLEADISITLE